MDEWTGLVRQTEKRQGAMVQQRRYQTEYLKCLEGRRQRDFLESRRKKGSKIAKIIEESIDLEESEVLDLGCSIGIISNVLANKAKNVVGIDIDSHAITMARSYRAKNCSFILADGLFLPFKQSCFKVIVCNQVLEHVPNYKILVREIRRAVKEEGLIYFATGNRFVVFEPHYGLPFLSWLPRKLANFYLKITGKGEYYYERLPTYWGLKKILRNFIVKDKTIDVVKSPEKYFIVNEVPTSLKPILKRLPRVLLRLLLPLFPGWIFILRKT